MYVMNKPALPRWLILVAAAATAFLCFAYPLYVIRPFRPQGAPELALALVVRRFGPTLAVLCAILCAVLARSLWMGTTLRRTRALAVTVAFLACGFAVLTRVNVYEIMFHPAGAPAFDRAAASKVEPSDMVLAVNAGGDAHAYPIRAMGYHHIVNDRLGGLPIVATD